MVKDWRPTLTIDPQLEKLGVSVHGTRFTSADHPDVDSDYRYELTVALQREVKRWPKGQYVIQVYDDTGVLLERRLMDEHKTLDKTNRQLSVSFYATTLSRSELIFESAATALEDDWESVPVEFEDEEGEILGVRLVSFTAESRSDFDSAISLLFA